MRLCETVPTNRCLLTCRHPLGLPTIKHTFISFFQPIYFKQQVRLTLCVSSTKMPICSQCWWLTRFDAPCVLSSTFHFILQLNAAARLIRKGLNVRFECFRGSVRAGLSWSKAPPPAVAGGARSHHGVEDPSTSTHAGIKQYFCGP